MGSQLSIFLLIIPILGLLHTAAFALFWLINGLYYADVNNFLFSKLGKRHDYIRLTQAISYWMLLWSIVLLFLLLRTEYQPGWGAGLYLVVLAFYLLLFYGSFWFLFSQSPVQWVRLWRLVVYFRFVLDLLVLVGLVFAMRAVGARFSDWDAEKIIAGIACLLIYLFL